MCDGSSPWFRFTAHNNGILGSALRPPSTYIHTWKPPTRVHGVMDAADATSIRRCAIFAILITCFIPGTVIWMSFEVFFLFNSEVYRWTTLLFPICLQIIQQKNKTTVANADNQDGFLNTVFRVCLLFQPICKLFISAFDLEGPNCFF